MANWDLHVVLHGDVGVAYFGVIWVCCLLLLFGWGMGAEIILETETDPGTKSRFHYFCMGVTCFSWGIFVFLI